MWSDTQAVSALTSRAVPSERRRGRRYLVATIGRLRPVDSETFTRAVIHDISSSGVFFTPEINLIRGSRVQLLVDWPVKLHDEIPLMLALLGTVIRQDLTGIAMRISRYDWKLRGKPIEGMPATAQVVHGQWRNIE